MILLDTNVLSELMRPAPAESVVRWMASQPVTGLYTTSVTQAEIFHGIMLLPSGRRRSAFEAAAEAMFDQDFDGRILAFGSDAARPCPHRSGTPAGATPDLAFRRANRGHSSLRRGGDRDS